MDFAFKLGITIFLIGAVVIMFGIVLDTIYGYNSVFQYVAYCGMAIFGCAIVLLLGLLLAGIWLA